MYGINNITKVISQLLVLLLSLIPLAIVLHILLGKTTNVFGGIVDTLVALLGQFGSNGLIGLIAFGLIVWVFSLVMSMGKTTTSSV